MFYAGMQTFDTNIVKEQFRTRDTAVLFLLNLAELIHVTHFEYVKLRAFCDDKNFKSNGSCNVWVNDNYDPDRCLLCFWIEEN